ncbi:MAG: DUF2157 domain-containing protein [Acidobacteriota bacterium]
MARVHRWLHGELEDWQAEGLIDSRQADAIRTRYPLGASADWGRLVLSAIGAVIIGLGVILFFAYNWDDMPRLVKLSVIFAGLIAAHGGGWWAARQGRSRSSVEAAHLLGTTLFGAGIWLVSQAYHIDPIEPDPLLVWGIGALATAWALLSIPQAFAAVGLLVAWTLHDMQWHSATIDLSPSALLALGVLPLALLRRSKPLVLLTTAALFVLVPMGVLPGIEDVALLLIFCQAVALVALAELAERFGRPEVVPIRALGYLVYLPMLFALTFADAWRLVMGLDSEPGVAMSVTAVACGLVGFAIWVSRRLEQRIALGVTGAAVAYYAALHLNIVTSFDGWWLVLPFNLALAGHGVLFILDGSSRRSWPRISIGCLVLFALASARFVDIFDSLLARSLAFLIFGVALVAVGRFVHRHDIRSEAAHD